MRQPRPWRSNDEALIVRRFVFQGFTCRGTRPSGRSWTRALRVSHKWLQKLVREFTADPSKMWRLQAARGDPRFTELSRAREYTQMMKERGELRSSRLARTAAKLAVHQAQPPRVWSVRTSRRRLSLDERRTIHRTYALHRGKEVGM
jgi:hypothetical protein